jgi:hypothetical protein
VTLLKVDAEGADSTILVSSRPLFEQQLVEFLIFEANRNVDKRKFNFPYKLRDAVQVLHDARYEVFLVGYWHERRAFVLTRFDDDDDGGEINDAIWGGAKLETVVAWPSSLRREYLLRTKGDIAGEKQTTTTIPIGDTDHSLVRMMPTELVVSFWNASVSKITAPKSKAAKFQRSWQQLLLATADVKKAAAPGGCFAEHLLVPCTVCGGETPRSWA